MKTLIILFLTFSIQAQQATTKLGKVLLSTHSPRKAKFINKIYKHAVMVKETYGVPISVTIGIAAFESSWGTSRRATQDKNFLGIKKNHKFCIYEARVESFHDFGRTLNQQCYQAIKPKTVPYWYLSLRVCGYCSEPSYLRILNNIIQYNNLQELD